VTKTLLTVSLLFIFDACKKDNISYADCSHKTNDIGNVKAMIAGTYTWTHTYRYYFTFQDTLTPQNQGRSEKYVFSKNGTVRFIENNQNQWTRNYEIDYEFKVTQYQLDSATVVIIKDPQTGQRTQFFRPYLCNDSAKFFNPYSSITVVNFYKRN
jgi:hypothetical protein